MARTARKKIAIYDEGVLLGDDIDSINLTGSGVSASIIGRDVTADITGGGSGGGYSVSQTPDNGQYSLLAGNINGSNKLFTVSGGVYITGTLLVFLNGAIQQSGVDFSETTPASGTFTMAVAPLTGETLTAVYATSSGGGGSGGGGAVDSVNGQTGVVVLDTDDVAEGTAKYFTDERAQDAVGGILDDGGDIDFTYDDATPKITAVVKSDAITYAKMQNVSATDKLLGRSSSGAGDVEEIPLTAAGRALLDDADAAAQVTTLGLDNTKIGMLTFAIGDGVNLIGTGTSNDDWISIPYACTINSVTLLADAAGSIVMDIWKDTYANYPPTVADTITASAKPTLSSANKSQDTTLTGWTKTLSAGDILKYHIDSVSGLTKVRMILKVTKT